MAFDARLDFISKQFLRSVWALEYEAFKNSGKEAEIESRLRTWAKRDDHKETSAEAAFLQTFFSEMWGYSFAGKEHSKDGYTLYPKYPVKGAGEKGGTGEADLAAGWFIRENVPATPQILCEFKDIKSSLDAPQKTRKNKRSPVKQCLDYLAAARRGMFGNESVLPTWGIVTDMNEFRLYWYDRAPQQYLRFVIQPRDLFQGEGLLAQGEDARFERFLFCKLFHRDTLLTTGGRPHLAQLIAQQWVQQRELENTFYAEYRAFRERLYHTLVESNPKWPHTKGKLVRLAQKILDRCIFIFFCEDMGQALSFPPQILRDFLIHESQDQYFDPAADAIWRRLIALFHAMNEGKAFGGKSINQFNGGLFAADADLEGLYVPNHIFCQPGQGQNEASLYTYKQTLLYLCAAYNYASGTVHAHGSPMQTASHEPSRTLGLYSLGRIFEQSITELEILEAQADGFLSINLESKRKRDGVYYTPEWVVERIVKETVGERLEEIRRECGWLSDTLPDKAALDAYTACLKIFKVLDPACGSGAFLITTLRYLVDEWHRLQVIRREVTGDTKRPDDYALIRDILKDNIYGVDINPASVEISQLALWLHTASGDRPLSSLDQTVQTGNSLIDDHFYMGQINLALYDEEQKERVNTFNWEEKFPKVKDGFDVVVGNPPYVKLQNFRKVHADMAEYLKDGRPGYTPYKSTQSGNFDLYLPFIEKGLQLLNEKGRMGYIAPSLWTVNEYGEALRTMLRESRQLAKWVDFKSYQVFEEATIYTALQFYTRQPNDAVQIAFAPDGTLPENPWASEDAALPYERLKFGERWLLLTGKERALIDRLSATCTRLDNPTNTKAIYQGLITSADYVYHLERIGPNKYRCTPKAPKGRKSVPYEADIEDVVMKPLVSGAEAKRYITPATSTYLLFPYRLTDNGVKLINAVTFAKEYPKAWAYLKSHEKELRARESGKMDKDEKWWGYVYPKNLEKHDEPKLLVPRLVSNLGCNADEKYGYHLDNVDVGGVQPADGIDIFFLAGILNSPVCNFVFRHISKPFRGDYRSANKQFIAPLPIPTATATQRKQVSQHARQLQALHTTRRDTLVKLGKRMSAVQLRTRLPTWLFPAVGTVQTIAESAPKALSEVEKRNLAEQRFDEALQARYDQITARLKPGVTLDAAYNEGELSFSVDGMTVIGGIFVNDKEGAFILAQWKVLAQTVDVTEKTDGKKLCSALRKLAVTDNQAVVEQIIALEKELTAIECRIIETETALNALIYKLYDLSDMEIELIKSNC